MSEIPENSASGTRSFFVQDDIRKARTELDRFGGGAAEKAEMRRQLQLAEVAAESGNPAYAVELTGNVREALDEGNPAVLPDTGGEAFDETPIGEPRSEIKRTYQDDSDDSGVSFQHATELSPYQAELSVRSHESEHVRRERFEAMKNGEVVYTRVRYKYSIDKTGKRYIAGGETYVRKRQPVDYKKLARLPDSKISVKA